MVAKLDRLSRSLFDFSGLMQRAENRGRSLIALDLGVDTSTPAGEMMTNVLATFAQFERRLIGQRITEALSVKKAQGVRLGRPRSLSAVVVVRVVEERAGGRTLQAIADGLNADAIPTARGGVAWRSATVHAVLKSVDRDRERDEQASLRSDSQQG